MEERKLRKKKERAINENNYEQIYIYCTELGDEHSKVGEYEEALIEYKQAECAAKNLGKKLYIAIANRKIGETLCVLGEFEEALAHQKVYLKFSREENDTIEEQRALATLGRTYFVKAESLPLENDDRRRSLELSRKYYTKSLNICDSLSPSNTLTQKQLSKMKARLYLNLGLTADSEGNVSFGIEHVTKGINICKHVELLKDLYRCHKALGSLYLKRGDTSNAILNYDEALKVANSLKNRILFSCEILSLKADVLIALLDFTGAKQVLIKAYKLKSPDMKERKEVEKKLKILVTICKTEKRLLEIPENDYASIKYLNETLGDCFAQLKIFKKAIDCYRKMLECSKSLGLSGEELISAYFSLSQTYKDDGQYDKALDYFERELDVEQDIPIEACKTLLKIIEILEIKKQDLDVILEKYQQALLLAKKTGDFKMEAAVLRNMIACEEAYNRNDLAHETQKELDVVLCCIPNEDSDTTSNTSDDEIEFDVDLEELSDLNTDVEDSPTRREKHPRRKITKSFLVRRNEKGETPLHVASAKGNVQLVQSLLKQGHPVNIADAAGWSPLHEACNHGQAEVTKILIDAGANIDDHGGPNCDGITPLHDAASCGHLEIIDLLLDNGASPLVRNNQGETALDCLIACKQRVESEEGQLDPIKLAHFNSVRLRLEECLSKVGYVGKKNTSKRSAVDSRFHTQTVEPRVSQKFSDCIETSRKRCNPDPHDDTFSNNAALEYQDAIQALRYRNKKERSSFLSDKYEKPKPSALLNDEEIGDDWLENDLDISKRPTKRRCDQFVGQQQMKTVKSNSTSSSVSASSTNKLSSASVKPRWDEAFDDLDLNELDFAISSNLATTQNDVMLEYNEPSNHSNSSSQSILSNQSDNKKTKQKHQKSLTSVGFTRFNPPSHSTQQCANSSSLAVTIDSAKTPNASPLSTSTVTSTNHSIKVRVEGKLFLVPVPVDHSQLNVEWLIQEASRRYQNLEGVSPVLSLSTEDGAILDENDPIAIVFGKNEIHATAVSWNLAPLIDRYKDACSSSNIDTDEYLSMQLDICQANACFHIKDVPIPLPTLTPALKAISYYQNLQRVCLCGVFLGDSGFKVLVDSVTKLTQIRCLDITSNNVTAEGLSYFILVLSRSAPLQNLEELNFSYNPLGEDGIHQLANLTRYLVRLRVLILKSVGLTSKSIHEALHFNFEFIEYLDVSNNSMGREECAKFLSALDSNKIKFLDVSRSGGSEVFRECSLFLDRGYLDMLETLKLADLNIDDDDVRQLIQSLKKADQLANLDLSCNKRITLDSHDFLSQLKNLKELNLAGCDLLTMQSRLILPLCSLTLSSEYNESIFKAAPYGLIIK